MQSLWRRLAVVLTAAILPATVLAAQPQLRVVAAENFYGDIATQIGGSRAQVISVLSNPDQDPHLFEASVSTARALSHAQLVIYNGAGYDPWMDRLLAATHSPQRRIIVVAHLLNRKAGDNPHLWYDPNAIPVVAKAIAAELETLDPAGTSAYRTGLQGFLASWQTVTNKVKALRTRDAGTPVAATEPVFGYMAQALGLVMRNTGYQTAVMNGVEPSASQIAGFEEALRSRRVKILFYNNQVADSSTKRAKRIAREHGVPVVGVSETMPSGRHIQTWMTTQLDQVEQALTGGQQ